MDISKPVIDKESTYRIVLILRSGSVCDVEVDMRNICNSYNSYMDGFGVLINYLMFNDDNIINVGGNRFIKTRYVESIQIFDPDNKDNHKIGDFYK